MNWLPRKKKKVQSNIDRLMRRSKVAEKKEWKTVRVKLWEKVNG